MYRCIWEVYILNKEQENEVHYYYIIVYLCSLRTRELMRQELKLSVSDID